MKPRIAIPEPCSYDREYSQRAFAPYLRALEASGAAPVPISLDLSPEEVARKVSGCAAVLLPGSKADLDPQKYSAEKHPETAPADHLRDAVDELLLQDAYSQRKPILGICYGLQALNVWRSGSLVQHLRTQTNHSAPRDVEFAHRAGIEPGSLLAGLLRSDGRFIPVNSSHHQAADQVGDGLRVAARCPDDGIIEAIEGIDPDHFVLGVQWHPERSFGHDTASGDIFQALVDAAAHWLKNRP